MRAALRGRNGVAIGVQEPLAVLQPRRRPFDLAGSLAWQRRLAGPDLRQDLRHGADVVGQAVAQAAGEVQNSLGGDVGAGFQQRRVALPADLDATEQVRLGSAQPVKPRRAERQRAEDRGVGLEPDGGAAAVVHRPGVDQFRRGLAPGVALFPQHAVARDLDLHAFRQGVDDGAANAMQASRGRVDLAGEFSTGMQRRKNYLQRTEVFEFRMRVDRNAAAVVTHGQPVPRLQRHLDEGGVAGDRLVHRVVQHLGRQMVQRRFVGAADIHARAGGGPAPTPPGPRCPWRSRRRRPCPAWRSQTDRSWCVPIPARRVAKPTRAGQAPPHERGQGKSARGRGPRKESQRSNSHFGRVVLTSPRHGRARPRALDPGINRPSSSCRGHEACHRQQEDGRLIPGSSARGLRPGHDVSTTS